MRAIIVMREWGQGLCRRETDLPTALKSLLQEFEKQVMSQSPFRVDETSRWD